MSLENLPMLSDPRSIAFITECINPQLRLAPKDLQSFYSAMINEPELSYSNFNLVPGGATLGTVHGEAGAPNCVRQSVLAFRPDRIQVSEEWPMFTLDDYLSKMKCIFDVASNSLTLPPFAAVTTTTRCLVGVQNMANSQEFLNKAFFRIDQHSAETLGRGTNLLGLRMAFPGTTPQEAAINLRVESFTNDISSLFVEVTAMQPVLFKSTDISAATDAMQRSYDFLNDNVMSYLTLAGERSY
jgi:hypothetical protein